MRWEALFADLEAEYDAAEAAELAGEVADRTRRELARLRLVDRLRPHLGHPLTVEAMGAPAVAGRLVELGPDWLLVAEDGGREALLALASVLSITGLGVRSGEPDLQGKVDARLDLRVALRRLARSRAAVQLVRTDGAVLSGTLDRVGHDYCELAQHAAGELRRPAAVRGVRTVPLAALCLVRTA